MSRVVRNISYNFMSEIWLAGVTFVSLPLIVHKLGASAYGVLAIVQAMASYLLFLDFGFGVALTKFVAEYYAVRDYVTIKKICGTLLSVYIGIGIVGAGTIFGLSHVLAARWLQIPPDLVPQAVLAFRLSALAFLLNMPLSIFGSIPDALQRMDITNKRNMVIGTLYAGGTIALVYSGFGVPQIVLLELALNVVALTIFIRISRRLLGGMSFTPRFDYPVFKKLLSFSAYRFVASINNMTVYQLDRLIIGLLLPIRYLTYYTVSLQLVRRLFNLISNNILRAVFPAVSELASLGQHERLKEAYIRTCKHIFALALPAALVLLIFPYQILSLWMGKDFAENSAWVLRLLALGYLLISFANTPGSFATAMGRPDIVAKFSVISAVLNVALLLTFIPRFGIIGAPAAIIGSALLQMPFAIWVINRGVVRISSWQYVRQSFPRPLLSGLGAAALFVLLRPFTGSIPGLIGVVGVGGIAYLALGFVNGTLDRKEKLYIKGNVARILARRRKGT